MPIRHRSMISIALGMALAGVVGAGRSALKALTGVPDLATLNAMPMHGDNAFRWGRKAGAAKSKREARTRRNIRARSNKQRPAKLAKKIAAQNARRTNKRA